MCCTQHQCPTAHLHEAVILLLPRDSDGPLYSIPWRAVNGGMQAERLLPPVRGACGIWRC